VNAIISRRNWHFNRRYIKPQCAANSVTDDNHDNYVGYCTSIVGMMMPAQGRMNRRTERQTECVMWLWRLLGAAKPAMYAKSLDWAGLCHDSVHTLIVDEPSWELILMTNH